MSFMSNGELKGRADQQLEHGLAEADHQSDACQQQPDVDSGNTAQTDVVDLAKLNPSKAYFSGDTGRLKSWQERELIRLYLSEFTAGEPINIASKHGFGI